MAQGCDLALPELVRERSSARPGGNPRPASAPIPAGGKAEVAAVPMSDAKREPLVVRRPLPVDVTARLRELL